MFYEEADTGGVLLKKVFLKILQNLPDICKGKGVFLELGHFDKHSSTTQKRRALQGKISGFSPRKTLKMHFK